MPLHTTCSINYRRVLHAWLCAPTLTSCVAAFLRPITSSPCLHHSLSAFTRLPAHPHSLSGRSRAEPPWMPPPSSVVAACSHCYALPHTQPPPPTASPPFNEPSAPFPHLPSSPSSVSAVPRRLHAMAARGEATTSHLRSSYAHPLVRAGPLMLRRSSTATGVAVPHWKS
jgi:hypothetical protein